MQNIKEIKSQFLRLYMMALSDGNFLKEEWELLQKIAIKNDFTNTELEELISNPVGKILYPKKETDKLECLLDLSRMIWVDGKLANEERDLFLSFYNHFGLPHHHKDLIVKELLENQNPVLSIKQLVNTIVF